MSQHKQIFQANSPLRWKSFKWTTRIFFFILFFVIAIVVVAVIRGKAPNLPNIASKSRLFEDAMNPNHPLNLTSATNKKYKGFKSFLELKEKVDSLHKNKTVENPFIRAGFYDPTNASYADVLSDLEKNAVSLNTIFPLWFFLDPKDNTKIISRIDSAGFAVMKKNNLRIIPILSNDDIVTHKFDGDLAHRLINDPQRRKQLIANMADTLKKYHLQGINVDFEELNEPTNEPLSDFQKDLYNNFHSQNLLVTQDVIPDNDDYDFEKLNAFNDYIILMAYDQHSQDSDPGPVSAQKWIEEVLDKAAEKMDSKKIILGMAGYGYDWSINDKGEILKNEKGQKIEAVPVTYSQALDNARLAGDSVDFDNDNFNLHYTYSNEINGEIIKHVVWFTGAVTSYNIMRFSDEYSTAGTVLWSIGQEDRRLWTFYSRQLSNEALERNPFDYNLLLQLPVDRTQKPTAIGEGELLRILYTPQPGRAVLEIDTAEQLITEQRYEQLPSGYVYEKFAEDTTEIGPGKKDHKLILTFDDGPSPEWTPKILDILE